MFTSIINKELVVVKSKSHSRFDWYSANIFCQNCNEWMTGGFNDWRLPTIDDFLIIINSKKLSFLDEENYWSSDELPGIISSAFVCNIHYEQKELMDKQLQYPVFLVRTESQKQNSFWEKIVNLFN